MLEIVGVVRCTSKVKIKLNCSNHFVQNSAHFVLMIELLFTMLSKFEREVAAKDSTF